MGDSAALKAVGLRTPTRERSTFITLLPGLEEPFGAARRTAIQDAKHNSDYGRRMEAVRQLKGDEKALSIVARHSDFEDARLEAVKTVENIDTLIEIACWCDYREVRIAATRKLDGNEEALLELHVERRCPEHWTEVEQEIIAALANMMSRGIKLGQKSVVLIAIKHPNEEIRHAATKAVRGHRNALTAIFAGTELGGYRLYPVPKDTSDLALRLLDEMTPWTPQF